MQFIPLKLYWWIRSLVAKIYQVVTGWINSKIISFLEKKIVIFPVLYFIVVTRASDLSNTLLANFRLRRHESLVEKWFMVLRSHGLMSPTWQTGLSALPIYRRYLLSILVFNIIYAQDRKVEVPLFAYLHILHKN